MSLRLVSINIEDEKHLDQVLALLEREKPDVFCVQELFACDIPRFEKFFGAPGLFTPMGIMGENKLPAGREEILGVGIFSRFPMDNPQSTFYAKYTDEPVLWKGEAVSPLNRPLLSAEITKDGISYTIATTHFTWTRDGEPDARQTRDLGALLQLLSQYPEFILVGDMNAPRGMGTFTELARRYRDHIPTHYVTSLDPLLHKTKGAVHYMVDCLFSTPHYTTQDVRLEFGVSDHAAIVATIEKV